jgi:hypothetical protein
LEQFHELELDFENKLPNSSLQPEEELVGVPPDQLVDFILDGGQVGSLLGTVGIVPGVAQDLEGKV